MQAYINSANFNGTDEERFSGNSAINRIAEGGLDQLSGLSENEIISHVSRTSLQETQEPLYKSGMGLTQMAFELPSTILEGGKRIAESGFKKGLKETGETAIGSRPHKLNPQARLMTDILAPFGVLKGVRAGKSIVKTRARVSHIGKTKSRFRAETLAQKTSKLEAGGSVSQKTGTLAEAYSRSLDRPAQWAKIKVSARKVMDKVDPQGAASIRRNVDKIIEGKGSASIKATRINKLLFEQFNKGAVNQVEARAFSVYAAEGFKRKVKLPLTTKVRARMPKKEKKVKVEKVEPAPTPRIIPSAKSTPEQAVKSDAGNIMAKVFDEKIKEFKVKSDIAFKKANPQLFKTGRKSKQQLADEYLAQNPPQEL